MLPGVVDHTRIEESSGSKPVKTLKHMAVAAVLAMPATAHAEMSDIARKIAVQRACQAAIGDGVHQRLIAQQP